MTKDVDLDKTLGITPEEGKWKRRAYWSLPAILFVGGVVIWSVQHRNATAKNAQHFRTEEARIGDLTVTVTATGQLKPTHTVDVGSQVSGIMDSVLVNYNDHVKAGQVLAKIDTVKLDAQVLQDKASLQSAHAKVNDAKVTVTETEAEYKRMLDSRQRSKFQIVSQHDVDTAKASYDRAVVAVTTAEATVTQAEATLKIDETNVAFAVLKSPVEGMVLSRSVEPGQTIAASFQVTTLFEIAEDLRKMILQVNVDEADVGKVKIGQHVLFTVDAYPGRQFPGTITTVRYNSTTTNNVVTYLAEIAVNNDELLLRPGMTATATITVQSIPHALLVSNHALRFLPSASDKNSSSSSFIPAPPGSNQNASTESSAALNNPRVWVVRDGKPSPISVATGSTDGRLTEILSGQVTPGTPLIVEVLKEGK
ncbi:MAG: efflux RND transporter periplasmic adaptor subunit [Acidobacteriaceae bacterium]|jgi:HlyD family secretion protein|nr:efflux RND transporter periplasmic adaptor subunit [Acidobacteriaceae bacterium]